jgi:cytochrome o ubiquinol oxidase subunit 1
MNALFGKLTLEALPHEWFTIGGTVAMTGMMLTIVAILTYFKRWKWLWNEWLTSTDPKKIGIMYMIVSTFMLFRGVLDAAMIWLQQAIAPWFSYLPAHHFQQVFTAHGDIMVFFVTMGFLFGLMNLIIPLQIGARDLASPFLNTLGFWLFVSGAILINLFFVFGAEFAATGWLAQAPLSELEFSPGVGVDYWIWSLQISGLGTLLGGINFMMTILKKRAPGMTLMKMPMFTWTSLCSTFLIVSVFPILAMTINLLFFDRFFGMHFFTTDLGGNPMMYTNLIWSWGHPEVYILILPAFGAFSEIVATFSGKHIYGYVSMVASAIGIALLSMVVWLHHFFTMGGGANVNAFFGIMTLIIAIPTGAQVFNWIFTMRGGQIRFPTPMKWFLGFIATFTLGGVAGLMLAIPPIDFQVHNSLFLVAHFHTMVIGGALFGIFAAFTYWFPKIFGFKLNERLGTYAFWCWLVGFLVAFVPLYILGFMGATRRLDTYDPSMGWQWLFGVAFIGLLIIGVGILFQVAQIVVSFLQRKQNMDTTGDPWNGRTLEWATPSPAPFYNFALVPVVTTRDAFWEMKYGSTTPATLPKLGEEDRKYEDIMMPKNTASGIYISGFAFLIGFGFIWHIIWLIVVGFVGAIVCGIIYSLNEETEYLVPAAEVQRIENARIQTQK